MNKRHLGLVLLNTVTFAIMLFVNYGYGAGKFSSVSVGDISHKYDTLFAPASYAFIIWSLIFLLGFAFIIYQWVLLKNNDPRQYIFRTGIWFTVSNIANTIWIYCWINELLGLSVLLILLLLVCLVVLTIRLRLELDDEPLRAIFFVWWPIVYYLGWIMVATIACISAWLISLGWHGNSLGEDVWTILLIVVACILYLYLIKQRNMREAALVGIWAFIAIAVRQWKAHNNIALTATIASIILLIAIAIHGYKNRIYSPMAKIKRGEWN